MQNKTEQLSPEEGWGDVRFRAALGLAGVGGTPVPGASATPTWAAPWAPVGKATSNVVLLEQPQPTGISVGSKGGEILPPYGNICLPPTQNILFWWIRSRPEEPGFKTKQNKTQKSQGLSSEKL